jgi:DNA-binding response OmpR family regulator
MQKKQSLLIVEDEQSLLQALATKFEHEGFEVFTAGNGADGLDTALAKHPDIILLDIIMPVMDGMTMLKHLREDDWGKTARVIILTNLSDPKNVMEALNSDTHDFLVKSDWELQDIVGKVRERLTRA